MNRRKQKLILADLQFKVVFITLFVASFVLLINFQLLLAALWSFSTKFSEVGNAGALLENVRGIVVSKFFISLVIAVPLSISVAILYSFRFCGPIYRFKKFFHEMAQGGAWSQRCGLRKGDQLMDLCNSINNVLGQLSDRVVASHDVLQEVDRLLDDGLSAPDDATRKQVARIKQAIAEEAAVFDAKLAPEATDPVVPESAAAHEKTPVAVS